QHHDRDHHAAASGQPLRGERPQPKNDRPGPGETEEHAMKAMNQRGIAMPAAMIGLVVLTSLMVAFALLAQSEPDIANNHMMSARARAFAEAGVERALWAVTIIAVSGVSDPLAASNPPYDGNDSFWVAQLSRINVAIY